MLSSPTTSSFQSITPNPYALSPILCRPPKTGDALKVVSASFLSVLTKPSPNQKNRYKVKHTGDGGVFSDWQPMYEPSTIKADADRLVAHGGDDSTIKSATFGERSAQAEYPTPYNQL